MSWHIPYRKTWVRPVVYLPSRRVFYNTQPCRRVFDNAKHVKSVVTIQERKKFIIVFFEKGKKDVKRGYEQVMTELL